MKYIVIVSTLFVIGSLIGWVTEVLFRRFVSSKRWINPGFLMGPYLPIYGFGVSVLYAISNFEFGIENKIADVAVKVILIGAMMTLIEFIAGLIFIKGMKIKLWDYSKRRGNIMGIICPAFSLIWLVAGSLYYFFVNPFLVYAINWISENLIYTYFIGAVVGMISVDFAYSLHLGLKLKQFKESRSVRFEELKKLVREKRNDLEKKIRDIL